MRKTACAEDIFFDLPAYVALLHSLEFWRNYDLLKKDNKLFFFAQIILNPKYFSENDRTVADALFICEKSVQNYRRDFKKLFSEKYEEAKTLDTDTLLSMRNTFLTLLGTNCLRSFTKNKPTACLSSRVLQLFSDNALQQAK